MKKLLVALFLILLLSTLAFSAVQAMCEDAVVCPPPFHAHMAQDHGDHHGDHLHVGTDTDRNGDGWICVFHTPPDGKVHVHIDNNLPQ